MLCAKNVHIRSYSGPYFSAFRSLCIQSKCENIRTRITPNTDTFHTVLFYIFSSALFRFFYFFYSDPFNLTHFSPMSHFYTPWKRRETEKRSWFYEKNRVLVLLGQKSYKQTFQILWIFHIFSIFRIKLK